MEDVDIDLIGEHNKTDSHPDDTGKTIPLNPARVGDLLDNKNVNKKHHLEKQV